MSLACLTHGHPGCVGAEQDDCEIVTIVSHDDDRQALAMFTAGVLLGSTPVEWETLPMLTETAHADLVDRIRAQGAAMREAAGERGAELWKAAQ